MNRVYYQFILSTSWLIRCRFPIVLMFSTFRFLTSLSPSRLFFVIFLISVQLFFTEIFLKFVLIWVLYCFGFLCIRLLNILLKGLPDCRFSLILTFLEMKSLFFFLMFSSTTRKSASSWLCCNRERSQNLMFLCRLYLLLNPNGRPSYSSWLNCQLVQSSFELIL